MYKMRKAIVLTMCLVMIMTTLTGCGEKAPDEINVAVLKGATAIGMINLMSSNEEKKAGYNYKFTVAGTADEITAGLIKGDIQIAAIPANLASVLYNKSEGGIKVAAINTLGVLYVVETGDSINSVEDLRGRTIYSTGKGTTPEFTLNYLLSAAGLDPEKDVTIEFKSEAAEVTAILSDAENAVAMLPQPYVAVAMQQNSNIRIALDVTKEWEKYAGENSTVVTGVIAINSKFAEDYPDTVKGFLKEYKISAETASKDVDATAELVEHFDIFKAAIAKKAIPMCNIVYIDGDDMKSYLESYLQVLLNQKPESVGGKLPEKEFYYR